ncbi:adenine deaminase [Segetibacter sp. 3557_3]|uniref:adenine deaminase n=1 Tax=Segetibacter sp. 3557_3 TaxID=2547429 RepID=UPI001058BAE9|nr:adenine deaminase [Segetibacter sp. 3557_3]TDH25551.1 adenine deaminase [Segetibacter sp. 3557_3]
MERSPGSLIVTGKLVDMWKKLVYAAEVTVEKGKIASIKQVNDEEAAGHFIVPGFIDSHVHIESSMLVPSEFARLAVVHGTVGTVSDPHEIANVCGLQGVEFMIDNGKQVPFHFNFGAPSCVPATVFETAGAALDPGDVEALLLRPEIRYLSEMMNFPGVLSKDDQVMRKIETAHRLDKPVDGHAPGLVGEQIKQYIDAGISTDHECFTREEALEKLRYGMKILIREGSAARNFDALIGLLNDYPERIMFCSDDKHPDSLVDGHINQLCARAAAQGIDLFKILQAACVNPVKHYQLDIGLLREGDAADFVLLEDVNSFKVYQTYVRGELVAQSGKSNIVSIAASPINQFDCGQKKPEDFLTPAPANLQATLEVIEALDGQLITNKLQLPYDKLVNANGYLYSNPNCDLLKMTVVNRYTNAPVTTAWTRNFGLTHGAIASTVAHDSHNIIAVGVDEGSIARAVNLLITAKGGVSCVNNDQELLLPLPVAGLMSTEDGYQVAAKYTAIDVMAKAMGSNLKSPFMTLSFMALLVIPHIKLSDLGLFDGDHFRFYES